jgi:hypothetical protein
MTFARSATNEVPAWLDDHVPARRRYERRRDHEDESPRLALESQQFHHASPH